MKFGLQEAYRSSRAGCQLYCEVLETRTLLAANLVADLQVGQDPWIDIASTSPTTNGDWFFARELTQHHQQLWATDGTQAGTRLVRDFVFDYGNRTQGLADTHGIHDLQVAGDAAYFLVQTESVQTGVGQFELWTSDGTAQGTLRLSEVSSAPYADLTHVSVVGDQTMAFISTIFVGDIEPVGRYWITNGTSEGTQRIQSSWPAVGAPVRLGDRVFFTGHYSEFSFESNFEASSALYGVNLQSGNVETSTSIPVNRVAIGGSSTTVSHQLSRAGDQLYFMTSDGAGSELWASDGTDAGTRMVLDLDPDATMPEQLDQYFAPQVLGSLETDIVVTSNGTDYWKSDGTIAGTVPIPSLDGVTLRDTARADVLAVLGGELSLPNDDLVFASLPVGTASLNPRELVMGREGAFFAVGNEVKFLPPLDLGAGARPDSAATVTLIDGVKQVHALIQSGGHIFASVSLDNSRTQATHLLQLAVDGEATVIDSTNQAIVSLSPFADGKVAYLKGSEFAVRRGLWTAGGEAAPQQIIFDGLTERQSRLARILSSDGSELFFVVDDQLLKMRADGQVSSVGKHLPQAIRQTEAGTYFLNGEDELELWFIEPGQSDAVRLAVLGQGTSSASAATDLRVSHGKLFFTMHGNQFWVSDGTQEGTALVREFADLNLADASTLDGRLVFSADDGVHGMEPWSSDGTVQGTWLEKDIAPGSGGSFPHGFAAAVDQVLFSAVSNQYGRELYSYRAELAADFNQDDVVDFSDFLIISRNYGMLAGEDSPLEGDIDLDGRVDVVDFEILMLEFGRRLR